MFFAASLKNAIKTLFIMLLCIAILSTTSFASNSNINPSLITEEITDKIKIGVFDFDGYYSTDESGKKYGYGYEYLDNISKHSGLEFEYIDGDWGTLLKMLEKGEIDLLDTSQKKPEREAKFLFSELSTGISYGAVFVRADNNNFSINDYKSLDGKKVGLLSGNSRSKDFNNFCTENNISTINIEFQNISQLEDALQNNAVDAIITSNLRVNESEKEIIRFSPSPFYMITNKDNPKLMDKIDDVLNTIQSEDPYYNLNLYKKYYSLSSSRLYFTKEEQDFINNAPVFKMAYNPNLNPLEYYDAGSNLSDGINPEIIEMISQRSGIKFEMVHTNSYEDAINLINNGEVDLLMSFDGNYDVNSQMDIKLTKDYISSPFALLGTDFNVSSDKIIALPEMYHTAREYANTTFPDNNVVIYESFNDCLNAILSGKADYTMENLLLAGSIIASDKYSNIETILVTSLMDTFAIAAHNDIDLILFDILNRTIDTITQVEKDNIIYTNTMSSSEEVTIFKFLNTYKNQLIAIFIIIIIAIFLVVIYTLKKHKKALWQIAYIDKLTGISNLEKFKLDMQHLLLKNADKAFCIVRFDVEQFKILNDMFGFNEGNQVLINIVKSAKKILADDELFARISNDNFILLLHYKSHDELIKKWNDFINKFSETHYSSDISYKIDFKSGIYVLKPEDADINTMIDKAIMAHQACRTSANDDIVFYNDDIRDLAIKIKKIENSMYAALEAKEFVVYMQPKFYLDTLKISGAEALIRWKNSQGGLIPPDEFIPIFEKNGFVINIDNYVLEETCKFLKELILDDIIPVPISVNQSKLHLKNPNYINNTKAIIDKYGISPHLIELELTETTLHNNLEELINITDQFKKYGITISIDDFGSGYSSLNLLKDISVDVLKIDKEFLKHAEENHKGRVILANIIRLAKELKLRLVTEGVETVQHEALLKNLMCDIVQGFLYAKPMPINEFRDLLIKEQKNQRLIH